MTAKIVCQRRSALKGQKMVGRVNRIFTSGKTKSKVRMSVEIPSRRQKLPNYENHGSVLWVSCRGDCVTDAAFPTQSESQQRARAKQ